MPASRDKTFRCYSCSRRFHWRDDLPGRTIRCTCGVKFRCPDLSDDHLVAEESLDDTVADVSLDETLEEIGSAGDGQAEYDVGPLVVSPRGLFGLTPAGETLFWGIGVLLGVSFGLLAVIVGAWGYIVCAVLLSVSVLKFRRSWRRWTRGRPWMQCLLEALGEGDTAEG